MAKNKSTRKKYKIKTIYYNPVDVAVNRASKISADICVQLQIVNHNALQQIHNCTANIDHIRQLVAAINMSDAMQHIRLGHDYVDLIRDARSCVLSIATRYMQQVDYRPTDAEMITLDEWISLHDAQLDIASNGDILACQDLIHNHIRSGNVDRIKAPICQP